MDAAQVAAGSVRPSEVRSDGADLYWLENRPGEGGRVTLVRRRGDGTLDDVLPDDANVRTRVHEYGGGSYAVHDGTVWFTHFPDQRIYRLDRSGGAPEPITPDTGGAVRFADLQVIREGRWLLCVRETHPPGDRAAEVTNELVAVPADGNGDQLVLATGRDFYAAPRVDHGGAHLAWLEWDHPNMPWDGTELRLAQLDADVTLGVARTVAGGPDESVFQPAWSRAGDLHFVSDRTGWWNLYRLRGGAVEPVHEVEVEVGQPQWVFGQSRYAFLGEQVVVARFRDGADELVVLGADGERVLDTGVVDAGYLVAHGERAVLVAATPAEPAALWSLDPGTGTTEVLHRPSGVQVDDRYVSGAEPITFPTEDGPASHALYYPPRNPEHRAPDGERPPLLVLSHGGPTSHRTAQFYVAVQFWTSRGFAVVDVNYRGSTGYGRAYRQALNGRWGIVDREDCIAAARFLAGRGDVDPERLAIRGGSAGGYTTLCALTFDDVFAAGASYFGVADAEALARETHKFESRYLDRLIGPYPEAADLYRERSPVHHTERLSAPMILFQGLEDEVVPPAQAEAMVAALDARGLPHAYLAFEGEQHGFRRAENAARCLEAELSFYGRVFGFEPADDLPPLDVRHA